MTFIHTNYMGFGLEFSPFYEDQIGVATCENYSFSGKGELNILKCQNSLLNIQSTIQTKKGIFDLSWCENQPSSLIMGLTNGLIELWNVNDCLLVQSFMGHSQEVFSVDWNTVRKDTFISGSWDGTIRFWQPPYSQSLRTFSEHNNKIYSVSFSPYYPEMFSSASGDGSLKIWDGRGLRSQLTINISSVEILNSDWNKYQPSIIAVASTDHSIYIYDIRFPLKPISRLTKHKLAVSRVRWSPHEMNILLSSSYDMNIILWDALADPVNAMLEIYSHHHEFVYGVDFNLFVPGMMASCGWDCGVFLWSYPNKPKLNPTC